MPGNLVRTTTYFDPYLLDYIKRMAVDEKKTIYEVINTKLGSALGVQPAAITAETAQKPFSFRKVFGTFDLGLRKQKITRADAYEDGI